MVLAKSILYLYPRKWSWRPEKFIILAGESFRTFKSHKFEHCTTTHTHTQTHTTYVRNMPEARSHDAHKCNIHKTNSAARLNENVFIVLLKTPIWHFELCHFHAIYRSSTAKHPRLIIYTYIYTKNGMETPDNVEINRSPMSCVMAIINDPI